MNDIKIPLQELGAEFVRGQINKEKEQSWRIVETIDEANGLQFKCPACYLKLGRTFAGCHSVIVWSRSRGASDNMVPGPGRWKMTGTNLADLTLTGDSGKSNSIQLTGGCGWHGFIKNGEATFA